MPRTTVMPPARPEPDHSLPRRRPGWPLEDADHDLADYLTGEPCKDAQRLVEDAVRWARALPDPYADNATALVVRVA
ncbi:hypothetical protein ACFV1C_09910 [Streptomyces sp. NPDC059605]|uniref:hypothetical protein n=1 Tax=unclassified Streptomyces TaxID=2593676 RepID=UPI0036A955B7